MNINFKIRHTNENLEGVRGFQLAFVNMTRQEIYLYRRNSHLELPNDSKKSSLLMKVENQIVEENADSKDEFDIIADSIDEMKEMK